jgi:hypothetical protein
MNIIAGTYDSIRVQAVCPVNYLFDKRRRDKKAQMYVRQVRKRKPVKRKWQVRDWNLVPIHLYDISLDEYRIASCKDKSAAGKR